MNVGALPSEGFHNIDELPEGNILGIRQEGPRMSFGRKKKGFSIKRLLDKGFPPTKITSSVKK